MKILFIGPTRSTFAKNDMEILLRTGAELVSMNSSIGGGIKGVFRLASVWLKSIYYALRSDAVFCWFADYANLVGAIAGKLFGKKVFVVAGGFDVLNFPEFQTGSYLRPFRWFCTRNTFKAADAIYPVSQSAMDELMKLLPEVGSKCKVIYNCVNSRKLDFFSQSAPRNSVLTVNGAGEANDYLIKGMPRFFEAASLMPDTEFICAGLRGNAFKMAEDDSKGLANVTLIKGPLDLTGELIPLYNSASVYYQPSYYETFGVAVIESALCGCVPVVTRGGALPETAPDPEFIVDGTDEAVSAIKKALLCDAERRAEIRQAAMKFDFSVRETALIGELVKFFSSK